MNSFLFIMETCCSYTESSDHHSQDKYMDEVLWPVNIFGHVRQIRWIHVIVYIALVTKIELGNQGVYSYRCYLITGTILQS